MQLMQHKAYMATFFCSTDNVHSMHRHHWFQQKFPCTEAESKYYFDFSVYQVAHGLNLLANALPELIAKAEAGQLGPENPDACRDAILPLFEISLHGLLEHYGLPTNPLKRGIACTNPQMLT